MPRKTERIQQWLSTCETRAEEASIPQNLSPNNQYKMRCVAKPIRHPSPPSQPILSEKSLSPSNMNEVEPGRFRTSLKIHLEPNESTNPRSRASSATTKSQPRHPTISNDHHEIANEKYFSRNPLPSTGFPRDHQAVFL